MLKMISNIFDLDLGYESYQIKNEIFDKFLPFYTPDSQVFAKFWQIDHGRQSVRKTQVAIFSLSRTSKGLSTPSPFTPIETCR